MTITTRLARWLFSRRLVLSAGRELVKRLDVSVFYRLWSEAQRLDPSALDEALGALLTTDLVVVDVGARWGAGDRWRAFRPHVRVVGFDPDEDECHRLAAQEEDDAVSYVPVALGATSGDATLHLTVEPACSSLYPPIEDLIAARPMLTSSRPTGTARVALRTLDDWFATSDLDHIDVVKLDAQGAELAILEGAPKALATVRLLEVEVEFNELYAGQPLFADVDRFLRAGGFVLWRLKQLVHYGLADVPSSYVRVPDTQHFDARPHPFDAQGGQLFWGHAYYVRREMAFPGDAPADWQQAVRDACGASAFGFTDLALSLLAHARAAAPSAASAHLDRLLAAGVPGERRGV